MPVASLEILDCGFESRELALQAGDCLIQPRFCAFDIQGALIVLGNDRVLFSHSAGLFPPSFPPRSRLDGNTASAAESSRR